MVLIIIDGDTIARQAAYAVDAATESQSEREFLVPKIIENTLSGYSKTLSKWVTVNKCELWLTPRHKKNFRYEVAKTQPYHANRINDKPPSCLWHCREYLQKEWKANHAPDHLEADDMLAIRATEEKGNCLLLGNDKDFRQIDCGQLNYEMDDGPFRTPYKVESPGMLIPYKACKSNKVFGTGKAWLCFQLLRGDKEDHIKGVGDFSEIAVYHTLNVSEFYDVLTCGCDTHLFDYMLEIYKYFGASKERLIENMRLLWLRRTRDEELWQYPHEEKEDVQNLKIKVKK